MADLCMKRNPGGVERCTQPKGHRDDHREGSLSWRNHKGVRQRLESQSRISPSSDVQDYRTGVLHGILADRIMSKMSRTGVFVCEGVCGRTWTDVHDAIRDCVPSHVQPRVAGGRARRKETIFRSMDNPANIKATCVECNDKVDIRHAAR
jgi:5-methylcytosine-specific restriction endonuclease McrA